MQTIIETKDLILKKAVFDDWVCLYENIWSQEESARYMLWRTTKSTEEAKERMKRTMEYQKGNLAYTVYEKNSKQAIGFAGIVEIEPNIYEDTGIAIGPDFVGGGYGKQILNALMKYSFKELNAVKFICSCRTQNIASKKIQQSCGLKYTHSETRVDKQKNEEYIVDFYELSRSDYGGIIVEAPKLIIIRGNSGSGKTTTGKALQKKLGHGTMLISQDVIRRDVLYVKDGPEPEAALLLHELVMYGKKHCDVVILEGILNGNWYKELFEEILNDFQQRIYAYYFDIPFEETLNRHKGKPNAKDFGEVEMKSWWNEKDFLQIIPEVCINKEMSLNEIVDKIYNDVKRG